MDEKEIEKINFDNINYAIYTLGNWKNDYKINQIGLSNEIPATENTKNHVIFTMNEIRNAEFEIENIKLNGFVAIAYQVNPEIREMNLEDAIKLENEEYIKIKKELDNLELLPNDGSVDLENSEFLIYKLEKECHVTKSKPANKHTMEHYLKEIKKIEDSVNI